MVRSLQAAGTALEATSQTKAPQQAASGLAKGLLASHILHHKDKVKPSQSLDIVVENCASSKLMKGVRAWHRMSEQHWQPASASCFAYMLPTTPFQRRLYQ